MSYSAEKGNFEGRSRAPGGFGNETGQTDRRSRNGEAEKANRAAIDASVKARNREISLSAPQGPFKSANYPATLENLAKMTKMAISALGGPIGMMTPVGQAVLSGDVYGAFGRPTGWSSYSQRDINPMGSNPRGNIGGRDTDIGNALTQARHNALLEEARRRQANRPKSWPHPTVPLDQYMPPSLIFDHVPGLPSYGVAGPSYTAPMPGRGKASGYGGVARPSPIPYPNSYR
jgi:hypothetical protein